MQTPSFVRRFLLGSGPLKRASDRLLALSRSLVLIALVAAVPAACAVGAAARSDLTRTAAQQAAERHEVTATLVADALLPGGRKTMPIGRAVMYVPTDAVWADPGGLVRDIKIPVLVGARAGDAVTIWVDRNGGLTDAPLPHSDVIAEALIRAALTVIGVVMLAVGGHLGVVAVLDRRRARRWAAEWALVEPQWAGRVR